MAGLSGLLRMGGNRENVMENLKECHRQVGCHACINFLQVLEARIAFVKKELDLLSEVLERFNLKEKGGENGN